MDQQPAQQETKRTSSRVAQNLEKKLLTNSTVASSAQAEGNSATPTLVKIPSSSNNNGKPSLALLSDQKSANQEQGPGGKGQKGGSVSESATAAGTKSSAKNKINSHEEEKQPSSSIQIKSASSMETPKVDSKPNTLNKSGQKQEVSGVEMKPITDKFFYKEMAKIKEKGAKGVNAVPPKKSASAYIIFQKEKRPEILARNPTAKVTEVVKEIARCWGLMTKDDRSKYKEQAKRDKERYDRELKQLEGQSDSIKKPKKCLSAYMIFVKETRPKIVDANPDMGALEVMQEVGRAWQSMKDDERSYFKRKADNDKHRYLEEQRRFYDEVAKVSNTGGKIDEDDIEDDPQELVNKLNMHKLPQDTQKNQSNIVIDQGQKQMVYNQMQQQNLEFGKQATYNVLQQKRGPPNDAMQLLQQMQMSNMGGAQQKNMFTGQMNQISLAQNLMNNMQMMGGLAQQPQQMNMQQMNSGGDQVIASSANKRQRTDEDQGGVKASDEPSQNVVNSDQNQNSVDKDGEPKQPSSSHDFFSQELKTVLQQQFPQITESQINDMIQKQWKSLTKKLKAPFESMANEDKLRYNRENVQHKAEGKFQPQTSQLAINRYNLSVHNQQLLKEAVTLSKAFVVELNQAIKDKEQQSDQQQNAQANQLFKTTQYQHNTNQEQQQSLQNMNQATQEKQTQMQQNGQNNQVQQQVGVNGMAKIGNVTNNEMDVNNAQDQNQGALQNAQLLSQQQINNQNQQILQLLMNSNLSTQLLQNAIQLQQPQNAFLNPQQLNLAAQLGAQSKNMNQMPQNNNSNLNDLLTNVAMMNQNIGNKTNGSPQFVGQQTNTMNDTNVDLSNQLQNMPSVANQPINNIFNPIGNPLLTAQLLDQDNFGFGHQTPVQQAATPMTGATQLQQPLIQGDFQLPGSSFYGDTQANQQTGNGGLQNQSNQFFMGQPQSQVTNQMGQSEQDPNKLSCVNQMQSLKPSPCLGPTYTPMNTNLVDNVNPGDAFNWNNIANNDNIDLQGNDTNLGVHNSLLMRPNKSDGNFFKQNSNGLGGMKMMQQQQQQMVLQNMMPGGMNALKPMQDQQTISASASTQNLLLPGMGLVGNNPGEVDSTSVTPFLKPAMPTQNYGGFINPVGNLNQQFNPSVMGQVNQAQMNSQGLLPPAFMQQQQFPFNHQNNNQ